MICDRCIKEDPTVEIRTDCSICGPTPLCDECHKTHLGEILIENQVIREES